MSYLHEGSTLAPERPARQRRRRSDAERNTRRIVQAAMQVLTADPRASMQAVARESGLGRATVYRHFPTRDVLTEAIYRQSLEDAEEAVAEALDGAPGFRVALQRVTEALIANGDRYQVIADHPGVVTGATQATDVSEPLADLMERGQHEGALRAELDPRWLATTYSAILLQAIRAKDDLDHTDAQVADLVVTTWLAGAASH